LLLIENKLSGKIVFLCWYLTENVSIEDMYSENILALVLIHVGIFNVFINICLNSRRWFVLCLICTLTLLGVGAGVRS
jgi:hypothetical protein